MTGIARRRFWVATAGLGGALVPLWAHAAIIQASDGAASDYFGYAVSQSSGTGLVGAYGATVAGRSYQGAAYVFRGLDTATGTVTQNVKLTASDGAASDDFGLAVSQSGGMGLVGAYGATVAGHSYQGAAYVFRGLDSATGAVTQNVKLTASDGAANDYFGRALSQSGSTGLVGAYGATVANHSSQGAAYVFRGLDKVTGTGTEAAKLIASDGAESNFFGYAVSQSGSTGLVGAYAATVAGHGSQGAAYVFRGLDSATGTVTQNVKLIASDGAAYDAFGYAVSQSGGTGLVGAFGATVAGHGFQGAAYVFRGLDSATGMVTEAAKLIASDGAASDLFGYAVSQSGSTGLVGAYRATVAGHGSQGAAYVFRGLDSAMGTVTQNVKLTASDGAASDAFGYAVGLDGDQFTVGAYNATGTAARSGKAYSGTISSVTTLDAGSATRVVSGISFVSQEDWVVGQTTSANTVTLSRGDTANVTAANRGVFVGRNSGSSNNRLLAQGTVTAGAVTVSAASGATGNTLEIASNGTTTAGTVGATNGITVNPGGKVLFSGTSGSTDRVGNATALRLAGGTLDLGGLSEGAAGTTGLGLLYVTGSSTIDFGTTGGSNVVQLAGIGSHTAGQLLRITDWERTAGATDRLLFAGVVSVFTNAFTTSDVSFNGVAGYQTIQFSGFYEVGETGSPEPSSLLLCGLATGGVVLPRRGRARAARQPLGND